MKLIPYSEFGKMRLARWFPDDQFLEDEDSWYGLINEGVRGIDFMRSTAVPDETFHINIDLLDCPFEVRDQILELIQLPVEAGCSFETVRDLLGEPLTYRHIRRQQTSFCEFQSDGPESYKISCVITDADGLAKIRVQRADINFPKTPDEVDSPTRQHRFLDDFEVLPESIKSPECPVSKAKVWMETTDRYRYLILIRHLKGITIEGITLVIRNRTGIETTRIPLAIAPTNPAGEPGLAGEIDSSLALKTFVELSLRDERNLTSQRVFVEFDQFYGKG